MARVVCSAQIECRRHVIAVLGAIALALGPAACRPGPRAVASVLHLAAPPSTLKVVACEEWGFTDALMTCSVEVAPEQFDDLFRGYAYAAEPIRATSHTVGGGPQVGPRFDVVRAYRARPPEFKHGGHVQVFADSARRRAIIDLYEE
jgi:hypothetical protein